MMVLKLYSYCFIGLTCVISKAVSLSQLQNRRSTLFDISSILLLTHNSSPSYASSEDTNLKHQPTTRTPIVSVEDSPTSPYYPALTNTKNTIHIPTVGYSFYKTDESQIESCTYVALAAGVRHFDIAAMYGTNKQIGSTLHTYISTGYIPNINQTSYRPILIPSPESTILQGDNGTNEQQEKRRQELFISHKLSNIQQATSRKRIRQTILESMDELQLSYIDMISIHSPLTDKNRRLTTYQELVQMQCNEEKNKKPRIGCIGVCNYGIGPLEEIVKAGLPPPSVIQLELSPFNQHKDVIAWGKEHGCIISCAAWSKLSSIDGPQDEWAILASIAKKYDMTKAQVLVRWALQKGYISVPRSGTGSKVERKAIFENSYHGVEPFQLSLDDMETLDGLDVNLKAGKLGRKDGWEDSDVKGVDWDPTLFT